MARRLKEHPHPESRMTRLAILLCLVVPSCAHATDPVLQAPNLIAAILAQTTPSACPAWIKLEGEIGDPAEFVEALHACADRAVVVEINSPGGNIFGALEMQKAIERHPHPVVCVVDGMAASAAFVTLQSCDLRVMTDRSVLMTHHAAIPRAGGQSEELRNLTNVLVALDRAAALRVSKRMHITPEAYEARVSGGREWWLGLEDGLANHAIDCEVRDVAEALKLIAEGA